MGKIFVWLQDPPDPFNIVAEDWIRFLDLMARATLLIIASMVVLIVFALYRPTAQHRRIHKPDDLFAPFVPLRSLWLALGGALIGGGMCALRYADYLGEDARGLMGISFQLGIWTGLWIIAISWACFTIPGSTPARFKYRPLRAFVQGRGVKRPPQAPQKTPGTGN